MKQVIEFSDTNHEFKKTNLVTLSERKGKPYDEMKCVNCGLVGKRYSVNSLVFDGRTSKAKVEVCPNAPEKKPVTQIKITRLNANGPQFANLTDGSIHTVIPAPEPYKDDLKGVWVMGVGEPVKVLNREYEKIK